MPETTTAPKCRACIEQGIPGECTDPAHQVAPDIGDLPPLPPKWSDPGYLAREAARAAVAEAEATAERHRVDATQMGQALAAIDAENDRLKLALATARARGGTASTDDIKLLAERIETAYADYTNDLADRAVPVDDDLIRVLTEQLTAWSKYAAAPEPPAGLREAILARFAPTMRIGLVDAEPDEERVQEWAEHLATWAAEEAATHVTAAVQQARAEGAAGALRDAADAYEALSRNVLAATAFADQHYRAGGPTVPTLWLRHRADEVAAGGEQR